MEKVFETSEKPGLLAGLFVGLFGLIFSLILVEIVFRMLGLGLSQGPTWDDRPKRYFIHEASKTFQDLPYNPVKPSGTFRVAVIGDSFTFAPYMQFDDTFVKHLERWFNLNSQQPRVEVVNYGVPRYSTSHEIAVARRALAEGADLVMLQITLNDPEIKPYRPTGLEDVVGQDRFGQAELKHWIFRYWQSLGFVVTRIFNNHSYQAYEKYFFDLFDNPKTWKNFSDSLSEIASLTKTANKPIIAVVFPLFGLPNDEHYPFAPLHAKVGERLDELQIKHLDLFNAFKGIPLERLQVIPGKDRHPNEIAHRIAAEEIYDFLIAQNLMPASTVAKKTSPQRLGITLPQ